jgi:hypothetical protein
MTTATSLRCDGCGQVADAGHIARRLQRLEWATRFRPLHIQTLLLSGISPQRDSEFLYTPEMAPEGEARNILRAAGVSLEGKPKETLLTEFQKLGLLLTHALECPFDDAGSVKGTANAVEKRLPEVLARIRRSLKPKRVLLVSADLAPLAKQLQEAELGCPVFSDVENWRVEL